MMNIIKAILYERIKDKILWLVGAVVLVFDLIRSLVGEGGQESTGDLIANSGCELFLFSFIFLAVLVGRVCGDDFSDKTFNYEIMSGHTRKETYLSRVIVSICVGIVASILFMIAPLAAFTAVHGFGTKLAISAVIGRYALCLFPIIRTICFMAFVQFAIRNQYVVMAIGFFAFTLGEALMGMPSYVLGITNMAMLFDYSTWMTFSFGGGNHYVYDAAMNPMTVVLTIGISLVMSAFWLAAGYHFFKKDDIN